MSQQSKGPRGSRPEGGSKPPAKSQGSKFQNRGKRGSAGDVVKANIPNKEKKDLTVSGDTDSGLSSPDMAGASRSRGGDTNLDNWNPMDDDYNSPVFNSYRRPAPTELTREFHGNSRPRGPELQLYITGIPTDLDEAGLRNLFGSAGKVTRAKIGQPKNPGSFSNTTFGFVTMSNAKEVDDAIKQLNDYQIVEGQRLRVSISDPNRQSRPYLPHQKVKRGDHHEEGSGAYYRNINREDLHHSTDDPDREIESSPGNVKVHLRRSNSQEDANSSHGNRSHDNGIPGNRSSGRDEGYKGARKPAAERGVEGIIPTQREQMAMLLGMQQQAIMDLMNSRMNFSSLISPAMLALMPPIPNTASLEDVTTPPKEKKPPTWAIMNGGLESHNQPTSGEEGKPGPRGDGPASPWEHTAAPMMEQMSDKGDSKSSRINKAESRICLKCGQQGKKKCSICHSPYCSLKCQQDDWPKHLADCQKLKEEGEARAGETPQKDDRVPYDGSKYTSKDIKTSRPCRKEMIVSISYYESPGAFWVQVLFKENFDGWEALTKLMRETFNNEQIIFQPVKPQVGHVYACLREDDALWYRAIVRSIAPSGMITVYHADFGDEAIVAAKNFRLLNKGMVQLPFQSFKCCLKGVRPTGGQWTDEANERFYALVMDKRLKVNFSHPGPQDQIFYISKIIDEQGVDVIKDLIQSGFAEPQDKLSTGNPSKSPQEKSAGVFQRASPPHDGKPPRTTPDKPRHQTSEKAGHVPPKQTPSPLTKKSPSGSSSTQQGKSPSQQGKPPFQQGKSPPIPQGRSPSIPQGKSPLIPHGKSPSIPQGKSLLIPQGKSPSIPQGKSPSIPQVISPTSQQRQTLPPPVWKTLKANERVRVEIVAIRAGGHVLYAYQKESATDINQLQEKLQLCYTGSKKEPTQRYQTGDVIASVFSDQQWYRARVLDASKMSLYFIDYGGEMENSVDDCRALKPEFTKLPPQCLDLCLDGVSAKDSDLEVIQRWLSENLECIAEVRKIADSLLHVRLFQAGGSGECLNDILTVKGAPASGAVSSNGVPAARVVNPPSVDRPKVTSRAPDPSSGARNSQMVENPRREAGECLNVAVVQVTGTTEIWACLISDETKLNTLIVQLQEDYLTSKPGYSPNVGSVCVAMFDGMWYRAIVKAKLQKNQLKVLFIDYGNSSDVEINMCRELLPKYRKIPPFAIRLHLENAREEEEKALHSQAFGVWCKYVASVVAKITGVLNDRYLARIYKAEDEYDCFNDILSDVPIRPPVPVSPVVDASAVGAVVDVHITEKQTDPYLFYAIPLSQGEAVQEFTSRLTEACQKQTDQQSFSPAEGSICCSKYGGDELYRAMVQAIDGDKVDLLFIDYGNTAMVSIEDCCPLPSEFTATPMHAVRCRLDAVAEMAIEKVDLFKNMADVPCHLRVTRKDGDILVGVLWQGDKETDCFNSLPSCGKPAVDTGSGAAKPGASASGTPNSHGGAGKVPEEHDSNPYKRDANHPKKANRMTPERQANPAKRETTNQPKPNQSPKTGGQEPSLPFIRASSLPCPSPPMIGKLLPVSLTHLESPAEMYFHLCVMETLETLNASLKDEEFGKLKDSLKEHRPQLGELCMAYDTDQWCRAEVLKVTGSTYTLSILDYGYSVDLTSDQIRPALPSYLERKLACLKCSLSGVQPLGTKSWSKKAIDFARDTLEKAAVVQIKVVAIVDSVLIVEVYLPSEGGRPTSLAEQLISKGHGKEHMNNSGLLTLLEGGPTSLAEQLISKGHRKQHMKNTGPVVSVPHPLDNMELKVSIHGVSSPREFFCQIIDAEPIQQLGLLQSAIREHSGDQVPNPDFKPAVGEYCLAKFTEDDAWYRARVVKLEADNQFKVQFIDFGNYDTVPQDHLLVMLPSFTELCALAIPCGLSGFDASNIDGEQLGRLSHAFEEMSRRSAETPYTAKVVSTRDFITQVSIVTDTDTDIGQELSKMLSSTPVQLNTPGEPAPMVEAPAMSEIERLRAELAAKEQENQRLKQMLSR